MEFASILKRDDYPVIAANRACNFGFPEKPAVPPDLGPRFQGRAQMSILVHPSEWLVILGLEVQAAGFQAISHGYRKDRASRCGEMVGNSDRLKHAHRA